MNRNSPPRGRRAVSRLRLAAIVGGMPVPVPSSPSSPPDSYTAALDTVPRPDLFDAPVYHERNLERYVQEDDLELLRAGQVRVQQYEPVAVSDFAWSHGRTEYSWCALLKFQLVVMMATSVVSALTSPKRSSNRLG